MVENWQEVEGEVEDQVHEQEMKTKFALRVVNVLDKHYERGVPVEEPNVRKAKFGTRKRDPEEDTNSAERDNGMTMTVDPLIYGQCYPLQLSNTHHRLLEAAVQRDI